MIAIWIPQLDVAFAYQALVLFGDRDPCIGARLGRPVSGIVIIEIIEKFIAAEGEPIAMTKAGPNQPLPRHYAPRLAAGIRRKSGSARAGAACTGLHRVLYCHFAKRF